MSPEQAHRFAVSWYAAWNARPKADLDAIMSHYAPNIEHSSPYIARFNGTNDTTLYGIDAVRAYFGRGIEHDHVPANGGPLPPLRFNPGHTAVGNESVILIYTRFSGELAAEVFFFNESDKVVRSISHYA